MNTKVILLLLFFGAFTIEAFPQGTFQVDQQSATNPGFEGAFAIQSSQPIGQSFTPSFNAVGVVQLFLDDQNPLNSPTVYINLLANSITGPILAQTTPVTLPVNFEGTVNFVFSTPATVSPGTTYYLQPVLQSGEANVNVSILYHYSGGTAFIDGTADPTRNFYFREGIVTTPEPSTWALLVLGGGVLLLRWRKVA